MAYLLGPDGALVEDSTAGALPSGKLFLAGGGASAAGATIAATTDAATFSGSAGPASGLGTFTSDPLRDNVGNLVINKGLAHVALYHDSTGALVVRKTGLSTNAAGVFTFADALITPGQVYRVDWEDADGRRRMPRKAAT